MEIVLVVLALSVLGWCGWEAYGLHLSVTSGDEWEIYQALLEGDVDEEDALSMFRIDLLKEMVHLLLRACLSVGVLGYIYFGN